MSESVDVNIRGHETVSPAVKAAGDAVQGLVDKTQELGEKTGKATEKHEGLIRSFNDMKAVADSVIGITRTVIAVVSDLATEYAEQEKQVKLFDQAMKLSNTITKTQAADLRAYADTVQALTGVDDEQILAMETYLATSGRTAEQIMALIDAAVGLSAATGDDLGTTVEQLNKTFSGTAGRMAQLIPELQSLSEEELRHGDAVRIVAEKYKGLSDELGNLADTKLKNTKNAFDDAKAAMGGLVLQVMEPALKSITSEANSLAKSLETISTSMQKAKELRAALAAEKAGKATEKDKAIITEAQVEDAKKKIESVKAALDLLAYTQTTKMALIGQAYTDELSRLNNDLAGALAGYKNLTGKAYIPGMAKGGTAAPGVAVVGEDGPELVLMHGGETVIPNNRLAAFARSFGIRGYAEGTGGGEGGGLSALMDLIGPLVSSFGSMLTSLSSVNAILNPFQTILQGMFEIIGPLVNQALAPLVGILKIIGQVLGKTLAPVIEFFGNVIKGLAWGLVKVINGVIDAINWVLPKRWEIDKVSLADATSAGQSSVSSSSVTGASASYTKQRDITNYFTINTSALVGDDGFRQFALLVGKELQSAGVLGMA